MVFNRRGFTPLQIKLYNGITKLNVLMYKKQKFVTGFTLLEVMVTLLIFSIIAAAMFLVLSSGRNTWFSATTYVEVQQELRKAKEWVTKELCQAKNSTLVMPDSTLIGNMIHSDEVNFEIPLSVADGGDVTWQQIKYYLTGTGNKQLLQDVGGNIKVIANDIDLIDFAREQDKPQLIYITITASKQDIKGRTISSALNLKIKFRN